MNVNDMEELENIQECDTQSEECQEIQVHPALATLHCWEEEMKKYPNQTSFNADYEMWFVDGQITYIKRPLNIREDPPSFNTLEPCQTVIVRQPKHYKGKYYFVIKDYFKVGTVFQNIRDKTCTRFIVKCFTGNVYHPRMGKQFEVTKLDGGDMTLNDLALLRENSLIYKVDFCPQKRERCCSQIPDLG
jgi:predicted dithiol-disulfide oxidoreductase (DUF899 family)